MQTFENDRLCTNYFTRNERLASSAISSEKRSGQALMMEGGMQSVDEALAGEDARTYKELSRQLTSGTRICELV